MSKLPIAVVTAGMLFAVTGCGSTETTRAASGGATGAVAGAVVGGPVGAVVGGVGGAAAGATMDEGLETKVPEMVDAAGGSGTTSDTTASGGRAMGSEQVRDVQQALNERGNSLRVDGIIGPNTRRALTDFQRDSGLNATGRIDNDTLAALNLEASTTGSGSTGDFSGSTAGAEGLDSDRIRTIQQSLNDRGGDVEVDGVWGPETARALSDFQRSNGLAATGRPDAETLSVLDRGGTTGAGGSRDLPRDDMNRQNDMNRPSDMNRPNPDRLNPGGQP